MCENFWKIIRESYLESWHSTQTLQSILLFEERIWALCKILCLDLAKRVSNIFHRKNHMQYFSSYVFWQKQIMAKSCEILPSWKQPIEEYPMFLFLKTNASELCFGLLTFWHWFSNVKGFYVLRSELVNMKNHHFLYSKTVSLYFEFSAVAKGTLLWVG